jgi:hypothetical protein
MVNRAFWNGDDVPPRAAAHRPSGHERSVGRVLREVYDPHTLMAKLMPMGLLRAAKLLALLANEAVGRWLLQWRPGESRVLDFVGRGTKALCRRIYCEAVDAEFVRAFVRRRLLFCVLTSAGTLAQLTLQLAGLPSLYAALISLVLAPVTLIDRQFATLVTKMAPRHDRTLLFQCSEGLIEALQPAFPDLPRPTPTRAAGSHSRLLNLTVLEMGVGFLQFVSGLILIVWTLWTLTILVTGGEELPECLPSGDGAFCFELLPLVVGLRCIKELCNWVSALLEWKLTPAKYASNASMFSQTMENMLNHIGGIDILARKLQADAAAREACANFAAKYLKIQGDGVEEAPRTCVQRCTAFVRIECKSGSSDEVIPMLPEYLREVPLDDTALAIMQLVCDCLDGACAQPQAAVDRFHHMQVEHQDDLNSRHAHEHSHEHVLAPSRAHAAAERAAAPSLFRTLFLHEHQHTFADGSCIVHAHGKLPAANGGTHAHKLENICRVGRFVAHRTEVRCLYGSGCIL